MKGFRIILYNLKNNKKQKAVGNKFDQSISVSTSTASPVRSVMIVAPGDPIPPNLGPQQQLQLQQMSSDHHPIRPPSEAHNNYYG